MIVSLPIALNGKMTGTSFFVKAKEDSYYFATTAHQLGFYDGDIVIGIPPHLPNASAIQDYPLQGTQAWHASIHCVIPHLDLVILVAQLPHRPVLQLPKFPNTFPSIQLCSDVLITGYPYCVIDSFLQTTEKAYISAFGRKKILPGLTRSEYIVHHFTHPGSSGSPVLNPANGDLLGMVLGCLAPPESINAGGIPLGTDSNITYALSSMHIAKVLKEKV